jgi:putative heme-binding domain-containing protein
MSPWIFSRGPIEPKILRRAIVAMLLCAAPASLLPADEPASAVGPLMKLYQGGRLPAERQPAVVEMICNRGNENDLRVVFDRILPPDGMAPPLRIKAIGWLNEAARTRKVKPAGDLTGLGALVGSSDAALRLAAVRLAATLHVEGAAPALRKIATATDSSGDLRQAAIAGLAALGGDENRATLKHLAADGPAGTVRMQAVAAVAGFDLALAARHAVAVLAGLSTENDPTLLLGAFLDRKEGSQALAQALEKERMPADAAKRVLRAMYAVGRSDAALSNVLSQAAGVAADPPPPTQDEVAQLVREVMEKGDPARGERVFRQADLNCMRCHSVSRAGGQVGPDLSAVGGSSPVDYIVNSILNPNLAVKEQFVTRIFETKDGKVLLGIVIDRDESRVRIRDAQGQTLIIATADIEEEAPGTSMMPTGLTKFLTHRELIDLMRFIAELGRSGAYAVRTTPSIQRWRVLAQPPAELTAEVPHLEHIRQHVLGSEPDAWRSMYAKVAGVVPLEELRKGNPPTVAILRGELKVSEPGKVAVSVETTESVQVWVDGEAFGDRRQFEVPLERGLHQVIVRVEISNREAPELKVELGRPQGSTAQFEVVGGP